MLDDPAVNAFVNNFHDITELKVSTDELAREKALLEQVFENPHMAIAYLDNNDYFLLINRTFTEMFGYATEEAIGKYAHSILIPEEQSDVAQLPQFIDEHAELKRFTYTVSHDLKSPLITVKTFLGFIEKDGQSGDIERMKGDIRKTKGAAQRMEQHLDDLLELSRIGRIVNPPERVSFRDVVLNALSNVSGRIEERGVRVTIQEE